MCIVCIEEIMYRTGDTVDLGKGSDTEQSYAYTHKSEDLRQPFPALAHTVLDIVEGTADDVSVLCYHTIFHRQQALEILCSRTYQRSDPHPEQSSGTACYNSRCHTNDITGSDGSGQCRTQCRKAGYFAVFARLFIGN